MDGVDAEGVDVNAERGEVHFLAALVDELLQKLHEAGVLSQADLNGIEQAVAERIGRPARAW